MSTTLEQIRVLVQQGSIRISDHGYDELMADGILAREAIQDIAETVLVEDYPTYPKGPCVLVRKTDNEDRYIHVLWGIPNGKKGPAVLITAYRPDPKLWEDDFLRRKR